MIRFRPGGARALVLSAAAIALAAACVETPLAVETTVAVETPVAKGDPAVRMITRINEIRRRHELAPVAPSPLLVRAAAAHAADIAGNDLFGHRGSDGSRLADRLRRIGFDYRRAAENVAGGLESPEATVESWMRSPGHRRNLLDPNMCRAGVGHVHVPDDGGRVRYERYWVLVLARPAGRACGPIS